MPATQADQLAAGLKAAVAELAADPHVVGIVAVGSYVSGTMEAASDVDLIVLHRRPGAADRRYLRERRHGVLLDIKYWTPQVAQAMLCGPVPAAVMVRNGGLRVLYDEGGAAAALGAAVAAAGAGGPEQGSGELHPVERLAYTDALRKLATAVPTAWRRGDRTQAWWLLHWCAARIVEAAFRLAGLPYVDHGQGLRDLRRWLPELASRVEAELAREGAEEAAAELLALGQGLLGTEGESWEEYDTGWIGA